MRWITALIAVAVILPMFWEPLIGINLHEVIPGEVYRSRMPTPSDLRRLYREVGLKTVVSLRGGDASDDWWPPVSKVANEEGLLYERVRLSGGRMPSVSALRELVRILDESPRPLLIHCLQGVERTGLISGVARLLEGDPLDQARRTFSLRYGFWQPESGSDLPRVFDQYQDWLDARGADHEPELFRQWVRNDYVPYFYRADIQRVDERNRFVAGEPLAFIFRVVNTSPEPWQFGRTRDRGVHLDATLRRLGATGAEAIAERYSDATGDWVQPGESVEISIVFDRVDHPGRYRVELHLVDQYVARFDQMGTGANAFEIEVELPDVAAAISSGAPTLPSGSAYPKYRDRSPPPR